MQILVDKIIPHAPKISIILVCIYSVNCPRTIVPLLGHNLNISFNLFSILVVSLVLNLKAPNVSCELGLNNINCYLPLVGDI
jgi:hypothetical protein